MTDPVGVIMAAIASLLQGDTGAGRIMTAGLFKEAEVDVETLPARGCAKRPNPFNVREPRPVGPQHAVSSWTSGDYQEGSEELVIVVAYADTPEPKELEIAMRSDFAEIRRVLEWDANWALTTGWCGAEVLRAEMVPEEDAEGAGLLLLLDMTVRVDYRENRT